jgi:hypothetical protein
LENQLGYFEQEELEIKQQKWELRQQTLEMSKNYMSFNSMPWFCR